MANIVTETVNDMTDVDVSTGTEVRFMILDSLDEKVQALPPADPQNPTLGERLFVRVGYIVQRDDGLPARRRWTDWEHVEDGNIGLLTGDSTAMRSLLKKVHDQGRTDLGL